MAKKDDFQDLLEELNKDIEANKQEKIAVKNGDNTLKNAFNTKILLIVIVLLCILILGYFLGTRSVDKKTDDVQEPVKTVASETTVKEPAVQPKPKQDKRRLTEEIFNRAGIYGDVIATSYGNNSAGILAIINTNDGRKFAIYDNNNNNRAAYLDYNAKFLDIQDYNKGRMKFILYIKNDTHDSDEKAGEWRGNLHVMPIYAGFTRENGNIEPQMLLTANNLNEQCDEYLYETKNVDTINILLTEMEALKRDYNK